MPVCMLLLLLLLFSLMPATTMVAAIDPAYARNITVYHVNPASEGPYPVNMNTADPAGDLYFDMQQAIVYPLL
jgi:hypothetical protein